MTYPETPIDRAYDTIHTGLTGYYVEVLNIDPDEADLRAQNAIGTYADLLAKPQHNTTTQCPTTNPNYPEATNPDGTHRYPCILDQGHPPVAEPIQRTHIDRDGDTW